MIKIDLITGFLGSGKTTFIKEYVEYLLKKGEKICILENDYGAINIDKVMLENAFGDTCGIEMIVGGDGFEAHQRRLRTKLIAMAMSGYKRVIMEPSGIFDVDELMDLLYEEPLDRWYELGNIITIVDATNRVWSDEMSYLIASQCANSGKVVFSKTQDVDPTDMTELKQKLNEALAKYNCSRKLSDKDFIDKNWDQFTEADFESISRCEYIHSDIMKLQTAKENSFLSLFCFYLELQRQDLTEKLEKIFKDESCGNIIRIKGYMKTLEGEWIEINATKENIKIENTHESQDVLIIIGEALNKNNISKYFPVK